MLKDRDEHSLSSNLKKKKKYLYLDKFEKYKLSNDAKLRILKKAIIFLYIILGGFFLGAVVATFLK